MCLACDALELLQTKQPARQCQLIRWSLERLLRIGAGPETNTGSRGALKFGRHCRCNSWGWLPRSNSSLRSPVFA